MPLFGVQYVTANIDILQDTPLYIGSVSGREGAAMPQNARSNHSEADPGKPYDEAKGHPGNSESIALGEKGGSIGFVTEHVSKATSAAFHSQADNISGNTSTTLNPANILNTRELKVHTT